MKKWTPDPTLLGGMRATVHGTFIDHHDLKQAMAEKDREIAYLNARVEALRKFLCEKVEQTEPYQQLMAQAVRFAAYIQDEFTYDDDPRFVEAQAFLKEQQS